MEKVRRRTVTSGSGRRKESHRGWDFGEDDDWRTFFSLDEKRMSHGENN